jgi:hypothetical protein
MQPKASAYGPKGQENIAQALAHARQQKGPDQQHSCLHSVEQWVPACALVPATAGRRKKERNESSRKIVPDGQSDSSPVRSAGKRKKAPPSR